jgi:peroxiredoxin
MPYLRRGQKNVPASELSRQRHSLIAVTKFKYYLHGVAVTTAANSMVLPEKSMKRILFLCAAAGVLLAIMGVTAIAADPVRVDAKQLSQMKFAAPENPSQKKYLGLSGSGDFKLTDVKAKYIIIEVFSMYCPICQREASKVNQCHELIQKNSAHRGKVKLIGIGTGNTPFEVDIFRKKYAIQFPVLPDDGFLIQKAFSQQVRTPTFVIARNRGEKGLELVHLHVGELGTAEAFMKNLPLAP